MWGTKFADRVVHIVVSWKSKADAVPDPFRLNYLPCVTGTPTSNRSVEVGSEEEVVESCSRMEKMEVPELCTQQEFQQLREELFPSNARQSHLTKCLNESLTKLSEDLYSLDTHLLLELIQNAEDNSSETTWRQR